MVQYNKNIINNNAIKKVKNNQYGGNYILNTIYSDYRLLALSVILTGAIISALTANMFRLKLNGVVFPIIFGYITYNLYTTLIYHTTKLGISLTSTRRKKKGLVTKMTNSIVDTIYLIPNLVPHIPKIPNPSFNVSPFKDIRKGIRSLQYPYKFNGDKYKLKINFPVVKIPFFDPLAGICCVWEQIKKLIKFVEKAIEVPKKIVEKIFEMIKKAIQAIIDVTVNPIIATINGIVRAAASVVIGILYIPLGFLKVIKAIPKIGDAANGGIKSIQKIINKLQNPISIKPKKGGGRFKKTYKSKSNIIKRTLYNKLKKKIKTKGGNYQTYEKNSINESIIKYNGPNIFDAFYEIDILYDEEDYKNKVCKKKLKNMSIFKMYNIQNKEHNGIVNYVNNYKDYKFDIYCKKEYIRRKNADYLDRINPNTPPPPNFIFYNSKIHGYKIDESKTIANDYKKLMEFNKDLKTNIQKGGFGSLGNAINMIRKIVGFIGELPSKVNIICELIKLITNAIKQIGREIDKVAQAIFAPVNKFIKKIEQLIVFVVSIIIWFFQVILIKIVRVIEAAIEFIFTLSLGNLPAGIGPGIMNGVKAIFNVILLFLKLPFLKFLTTIVGILNKIPQFFKMVARSLDIQCQVIKAPIEAALNGVKAVWEAIKRAIEAIIRAMTSWGGGDNVNKLIYKHTYELNLMIQKRSELENTNTDKFYLLKLDKLIENKKKYIKKLKKLLLVYNKTKNIQYKLKI